MDEITTEPMTPDDGEAATAILTEAFHHDPVLSWLLPYEHRRASALQTFFTLETRHVLQHPHSLLATRHGATRGVLLVLPPHHWRTSFLEQLRSGRALVSIFGARIGRANALQNRLNRLHPREPHYYVALIGVAASAQGTGVGSVLLEQLTARCDAEGLPAYLEATSPESARLYRRHGFETKRTVTGPGRGRGRDWPPIELMARMPRPQGSDT